MHFSGLRFLRAAVMFIQLVQRVVPAPIDTGHVYIFEGAELRADPSSDDVCSDLSPRLVFVLYICRTFAFVRWISCTL